MTEQQQRFIKFFEDTAALLRTLTEVTPPEAVAEFARLNEEAEDIFGDEEYLDGAFPNFKAIERQVDDERP